MKKKITLVILTVLLAAYAGAQQDTMYIHLTGGVIVKYAVSTIDKIIFNDNRGGNTITDIDGNVYTILEIGSQSWLGQNLKTTRYNDGTPIPQQTVASLWVSLSTPAYCWYDNHSSNKEPYGAFYNWHVTNAAGNGGKNPCPVGWHVPDDTEWTTLIDYLGGKTVTGGKLKEEGTLHWKPPNSGATNVTGFTALPGGFRGTAGSFVEMGKQGSWWSSDGHPTFTSSAYYRSMSAASAGVYRHYLGKAFGMSIRCIKD